MRLLEELESELRAVGDRERAASARAYLKSDLDFLGVTARPLRGVARAFLDNHPEIDRSGLVELVQALWQRPVYDLRAVGVALLERRTTDLGTSDLALVEDLLRRSGTWALVDWLCTKVAAPLVEADPGATAPVLERWSRDEGFWIRRASMLAQLPGLRAGGGDFELFAASASRMVEEKEFFIRKAIGWVLRDVSRKRPDLAFGFLLEHIHEVSGLTLREGSKYLPEKQREALRRARRRGAGSGTSIRGTTAPARGRA
jgi:3-methyladenine DNA glycosylase AlkD